jgi:hypothetical protein
MNKEKDQLVRAVMPEFGNILEKEKRMQVCEVCGAMQASTDTEKRLASHLEGKQHLVCHICCCVNLVIHDLSIQHPLLKCSIGICGSDCYICICMVLTGLLQSKANC